IRATGRYPHMTALIEAGIDPDAADTRDARFEFGLSCILDGIAAHLPGSPPRAPTASGRPALPAAAQPHPPPPPPAPPHPPAPPGPGPAGSGPRLPAARIMGDSCGPLLARSGGADETGLSRHRAERRAIMSGFVLGPGEGRAHDFHGASVVIKASCDDTLGQLGVMEFTYPPGLSVHPHVHTGEDEMFYLLEGELSGYCDDDRWT